MNEPQVWVLIGVFSAIMLGGFTLLTVVINASVGGLKQEMVARFDAIDAKFDAVDAKFDAVDAKFDAVDAKFDSVGTYLARLDSDVQSITRYLMRNLD